MKTSRDIQKIAVLGAGTMCPGIAQVFAMGGYRVTLWTRSERTRERAAAGLNAQLNTFAEEGLPRDCGKAPAQMKKFIRGYIINRLQMCIQGECFHLIDGGYCDAQDIAAAVKASLIPRARVLGICKRIDFGGIDMTANSVRNKSYAFPNYDTMPG